MNYFKKYRKYIHIIASSYKSVGAKFFVIKVLSRIYDDLNQLRPSVRSATLARQDRCETFDRVFGVDTSGSIHHTELNTNSPNQSFASSYFGSDPDYVKAAIHSLPVDYSNFTFIDYGSGKGRVLLLATEFNFKRIIGVEFSKELHNIAVNNIENFPLDFAKCKVVSSVFIDAVNFNLPQECLVLYFFNPFDRKIMASVIDSILESIIETPREIFIIYANPVHGDLFDRSIYFDMFLKFSSVTIWRSTIYPLEMASGIK
jgi:SAM-dependent methyltransferase